MKSVDHIEIHLSVSNAALRHLASWQLDLIFNAEAPAGALMLTHPTDIGVDQSGGTPGCTVYRATYASTQPVP